MVKEKLREIFSMEHGIRELQRELRKIKGELFAEVLHEMGPEEAITSGVVTLNIRRANQIFK